GFTGPGHFWVKTTNRSSLTTKHLVAFEAPPPEDTLDSDDVLATAFLGAGFNTFGTRVMVEVVTTDNQEPKEIKSNDFFFESVETVKQLREVLNIDAQMSASGLAFSASA